MNKLLTAFVVALLVASVATADIPPPPPPKGKKYVNVSSEVVLGKDVTGYVFVTQVNTFPGAPKPTFAKVELTAAKAVAMPPGGRRTSVNLIAVPQDAAKAFKTDDELFDALGANKVKGTHRVGFGGTATVSDTIKGDSVKWTYTVTAIDDKGMKTKVEGDGYEVPKKGKEPAPPGASWVAGGAAALAVTLGGLWLVGRGRRSR